MAATVDVMAKREIAEFIRSTWKNRADLGLSGSASYKATNNVWIDLDPLEKDRMALSIKTPNKDGVWMTVLSIQIDDTFSFSKKNVEDFAKWVLSEYDI